MKRLRHKFASAMARLKKPVPKKHKKKNHPWNGFGGHAVSTCNVTGFLSPDATGNYFCAGKCNEKDYYRREDGAFFIWWFPEPFNSWRISMTLGYFDVGWGRHDPNMLGEYVPIIGSGIATVAKGKC